MPRLKRPKVLPNFEKMLNIDNGNVDEGKNEEEVTVSDSSKISKYQVEYCVSKNGQWFAVGKFDGFEEMSRIEIEHIKLKKTLHIQLPFLITPILMKFIEDDQYLYIASNEHEALFIPVGEKALIKRAKKLAGRDMTNKEWEVYFGGVPKRAIFSDLPKRKNVNIINNEKIIPPQRKKLIYPYAKPIEGKEGFVINPYTNEEVNVQGVKSGALVTDPKNRNHKFFIP